MCYDRALHAEAYRTIAEDFWLEMPDETRLRLFEMADIVERPTAVR